MDTKDEKIIKELKENSRTPIRDISKKTGIRPSTVHQRINKLMKNNIIEKFTIKLNNKAVGEDFIVFMLVATKKDLGQEIMNNKHIKEIFGVTGEYDLILKLKFKDLDEFNKFVINFRKNQDIEKTLTLVGTINLKEEI
ncbi:Lrp/AsnC family transcriptional regulator [Candidatus Woesearchaeota archaeon]|nr:Lrp/AsnC family transcriptional regulator [Candidatus Woesearchaeota archaeon]